MLADAQNLIAMHVVFVAKVLQRDEKFSSVQFAISITSVEVLLVFLLLVVLEDVVCDTWPLPYVYVLHLSSA
jgi:hypothetical protein